MTSRSAAGTVDALGHYERGASTYFAAQCDQRFGYYLYVPQDFELGRSSDYRLCVLVHGTGRTPSVYRDLFAGFADANRSIIVAPLFPAGIIEPGELANYKFIAFHDIRYDQVLNGIVDEIAARFRLAERRFLLFGYSGGGHFAHRISIFIRQGCSACRSALPAWSRCSTSGSRGGAASPISRRGSE